jgi:3-isopropylmalate/(R)-2-methylmalate dehydratase large subunit
MSNMSAELGSQVGLIAPDHVTRDWLATTGAKDVQIEGWHTDEGAEAIVHEFDASTLVPQVAAPHSPANTKAVGEFSNTPIQVSYIGACTGAKLDDLRAAAQILKGQHLPAGVRLMVAPASLLDQAQAETEGVMRSLREAGAEILPTSCGACSGYGGSIPDGANVIASTARNFKGRMGSATAQVYLASPYTVAASALRGSISDPREVLA